jgi:hypothetical protein
MTESTARIRRRSCPRTRAEVSITSSWDSGVGEMPAAKLEMHAVITGFWFSFRTTFSPSLPTLPFTTIFSSYPFDVTVCFYLAVSTPFYIFPDEVFSASFLLT